MNKNQKTQIIVIGGGPAGYSAAFRCSDLGMQTTIIEKYDNLGGVCLNVGCIPSKALLHIANILKEQKILMKYGILNHVCEINISKLLLWKNNIITKLTNGLKFLAEKRNVKIINGMAHFINDNSVEVINNNITTIINFDNAIIATGSKPNNMTGMYKNDPRIWNSTDALMLKTIPKKMLIIGAGIIGLEMATIYCALGAKIDIIDSSDILLPETDIDITNIYKSVIHQEFNIILHTKIISIDTTQDQLHVHLTSDNNQSVYAKYYDIILIAIGRTPNSQYINKNFGKLDINEQNFINVDNQMRTNIPNIYAIGDVISTPLLAHKGIHEGHLAAEVIAGKKHYFIPKVIPSIAYTNPEIGWVGLTEKQAQHNNIKYKTSSFPWQALGRALATNSEHGITKLIIEKESNRVIGGAVIGHNAGELLGEISLAIEMGCDIEDIALTMHAHPTLYESIGLTAEILTGTITDILNK
ncbi:dihydrolipoyl dehydrogenase [Enterobacteriaceae endosymbiont of Macroplea mutica]|uniref:dihydrolipoyl dehydrogenase n=1 Tax=Enterobacteriaceae endosymbiont of Macroplea mutica TaxID=2675791 RepID=UPI001448E4DD|nr:dihydrolipoyl dehydrogenase [Enterobacteriaceae endosymbiont of Macroplea mutica]QJC31240.1 dihydrolipoyl dehydrogenase [Enterobacteriaceae endosymbiont of Macroplea mutica]